MTCLKTYIEKRKAMHAKLLATEGRTGTTDRHVADIVVGDRRERGVTSGSSQARQVLAAVGISDHEPPPPPPSA